MKKNFKNLKIIVTGSTGFKGAWLCYWLNLLGGKVTGIGLKPEKNSIIFEALMLEKKIDQKFIDIKYFNKLNDIIKKIKPDIIFHLAAQSIISKSYEDPLENFGTNIIGSVNILESVRLNKVPNLVYITSDKCYLNLNHKRSFKETDILGGIDNYSASKASAEIVFSSYFHSYFKKKYLHTVSARAGNVIGGGDFKDNRIIPDIIKSLIKKKKIILRNPKATRPWQHVLEPLSGYITLADKILNKNLRSSILPSWNFGPYIKNCKNVNFIARSVVKEWGGNNSKIIVKKNINLKESLLLSLNIDKAKKELSWQPKLTLEETIAMTVSWYKSYFASQSLEDITNNQINFYTDK